MSFFWWAIGDSEPMRCAMPVRFLAFCSQRLFIFSHREKIKGFFVASITKKNRKRKALPSFFCFWWRLLYESRTLNEITCGDEILALLG